MEFKFIYNEDKKEKYTSIAMCKMQLDDGNIVNVYGYDDIADYLYRNNLKNVCIEGRINSNMMIKILKIEENNI